MPRPGPHRRRRSVLLRPRSLGAQSDGRQNCRRTSRRCGTHCAAFLALYELPIPTIAAVHGPAIAGGAGLATICDFTLATPAPSSASPKRASALFPRWSRLFSPCRLATRHARDLLLTGRIFDAAEAYRIGLVNEIVAPEELTHACASLAETLIANSPQSLSGDQAAARMAKQGLARCRNRAALNKRCPAKPRISRRHHRIS